MAPAGLGGSGAAWRCAGSIAPTVNAGCGWTAHGCGRPPGVWRAASPTLWGRSRVIALHTGSLLGGTVLVEYVFNWPGLSGMLVDAVSARDYPEVVGVILVISVLFVGLNFVVDLLYAVLDPRHGEVLARQSLFLARAHVQEPHVLRAHLAGHFGAEVDFLWRACGAQPDAPAEEQPHLRHAGEAAPA